MSSLKDIMDVDVELFESQAYRRSREAAQRQAARPLVTPFTKKLSPLVDDINIGQTKIKRRRSDRLSKPASQPIAARQGIARWRSSAAGEGMDSNSEYKAATSNQASHSQSPGYSSKEPAADMPVKYTPVTGRVSRAKKGIPVHTCDMCRPVKTFTRAEHLRRHQLSHQKPAYPCIFEDCERAFYRPDLLARHVDRHETQGERPYKTLDLTVNPPAQGSPGSEQTFTADSRTARISESGEISMTAASFNTMTGAPDSFQGVKFSSPGLGPIRSANQALLQGSENFPATSAGPSTRGSFDQFSDQNIFSHDGHQAFGETYGIASSNPFPSYTTASQQPLLPLLRIPEENWIPGLSYGNSPWCSSASDSTYSTRSDCSRSGLHLAPSDRAEFRATLPDWPLSTGTQWASHDVSTAPQETQIPAGYDSVQGRWETLTPLPSPRMSSPISSRQLLDVPNSYGGFFLDTVGFDDLGEKTGLVESRQLGTLLTTTTPALQQLQPEIDVDLNPYLSSYWQTFHSLFPIVHQPTCDLIGHNLLRSAMAAIGTQYHNSAEARARGSELNEYCKKTIERCLDWDLHTMQAILLTEIFTRFRGRKTNIRSSRHFEELYRRLLNEPDQHSITMSNQGPSDASSAGLLGGFGAQIDNELSKCSGPNIEWHQWIKVEARQRLLSGCFIFDIHQSMYHQQPRSWALRDEKSSLFRLPCAESLWQASDTPEWRSRRTTSTVLPLLLAEQDMSAQSIISTWSFTQSLIICRAVSRLPSRADPSYPNEYFPQYTHPDIENFMDLFANSPLAHSYMAFYHTPLQEILAIAGDTWASAQNITHPPGFQRARQRLRGWSTSLAAAQATHHACRVLSQALSQTFTFASDGTTNTALCCISDYWGLYISALICWAFGHQYQSLNPSGRTSANLTGSSSSTEIEATDAKETLLSNNLRCQVFTYTNGMLELGVEELLTSKASMKGETAGMIDAVHRRLEFESVGDESGLLVDAIGVLAKIRKDGGVKWF
ncbi:hypothetical protein QTJ16_005610 [Diplocarpon rosae]|uniref:C2H2-type domain-containing protein n=1 Tax=Diplocarpon rosae TaxID=946125 RepID=A0AAD9SXB0_9HELO|nr:hypothetical protein QTJ16_005610 [Diplocarpon rosae]